MTLQLDDPKRYIVAWIVATPQELAAVTALLIKKHERPLQFEPNESDPNSYEWGEVEHTDIVVVSPKEGRGGEGPAATAAARLLSSLPWIKFAVLVGVGSGIPRADRDIRLGDVVISLSSKDSGGFTQHDRTEGTDHGVWGQRRSLQPPPDVLVHAVNRLRTVHERQGPDFIVRYLDGMIDDNPNMGKQIHDPGYVYQGPENDRLFEATYDHAAESDDACTGCDSSRQVQREERDTEAPNIHYGLIASGGSMLKNTSAEM